MLETDLDSFIVRFVQEKSQTNGPAAAPWHGIIRHVQSKEEIRFTQIEDALQFVANYVELAGSRLPNPGLPNDVPDDGVLDDESERVRKAPHPRMGSFRR